MKKQIEEWEKRWRIDILFACEAGSRAWGADSKDSDYDVRFIYKQEDIRSYLSLQKPIEVIDLKEPVDAHGWDIYKAFSLASKSNPSIYEWAYSPILYMDKGHFSCKLKQLIVEHFSPHKLAMHYVSLLSRNLKEIDGKDFTFKKQKQLIQALRARIIVDMLLKERRVAGGPFLAIADLERFDYGKDYHSLILAKKEGELLRMKDLRSMVTKLRGELDELKESCKELPKGENFTDKLDKWLLELLHL